jgi:homoserine O-acetyltransferase/O-succinyltransferase
LYGLVQKQKFTIPQFTMANGAIVKNVEVGWESYGKLNADRSNTILVTHYHTGNSHAAGKYSEDDKDPGYWDQLIGPGLALDTDKYYVISSDMLANVSPNLPTVITTGPSTINPDTGKHYGLSFPPIVMLDQVRVQKALLNSLGIEKLHAVIGASGGAFMAGEWAAAEPDMVARAIQVGGGGLDMPAMCIFMLEKWNMPIYVDKNWNNGDYYDGPPPYDGVTATMYYITVEARSWDTLDQLYGKSKRAASGEDPGKSVLVDYAINVDMKNIGKTRALVADANHLIYTSHALQGYTTSDRLPKVKAKYLFIPSKGDTVFPAALSHAAAAKLKAAGLRAEVYEIEGGMGHLDALFHVQQATSVLKWFLDPESDRQPEKAAGSVGL